MRVIEKTRPVWTCGPDDTLDEAARHIWQHENACVAVIENGRTVGVITARDVCMWAYTTGEPLWAIPIRKVLSQLPRNAERSAEIEEFRVAA